MLEQNSYLIDICLYNIVDFPSLYDERAHSLNVHSFKIMHDCDSRPFRVSTNFSHFYIRIFFNLSIHKRGLYRSYKNLPKFRGIFCFIYC